MTAGAFSWAMAGGVLAIQARPKATGANMRKSCLNFVSPYWAPWRGRLVDFTRVPKFGIACVSRPTLDPGAAHPLARKQNVAAPHPTSRQRQVVGGRAEAELR